MYNSYTISNALYEQIKNYKDVLSNNYTVEHSEYVNNDPDKTPWVGVYKAPIVFDPNSLGRHGQSWKGTLACQVFIQASHGDDAGECSKLLGEMEYNILNAIWSDPKIDGNISMITGLEIEYQYNNLKSETLYYQQAVITVTMEKHTG